MRGQKKVPKEKATPGVSAFGYPAMLATRGGAGTRPGKPHKTRLTAELKHPAPLVLGRLRFSATHKGHPCERQRLVNSWHLRANGSGGCPPSALPIWCVRAGNKWNRVRVPQHGAFCAPCQGELVERPPAHAKSGTRRAAMWGRLFFGSLSFGEAKESDLAHRRNAKPSHIHADKDDDDPHPHTRPVKSTTRATSDNEVTPSFTRWMPSSARG